MDENTLYKKISVLQAKMLQFHKEMSPVKNQETEEVLLSSNEQDSKCKSTCISIAFLFFKILVCIIGAVIFPAIVYYLQGSSDFFWTVVTISCTYVLFLAVSAVTVLFLNMKIAQFKPIEMFQPIDDNFSDDDFDDIRPFLPLHEIFSLDFVKANSFKVLRPLGILSCNLMMNYGTYIANVQLAFYISLVASGFVGGMLMAVLGEIFLKKPELLPVRSPRQIRMEVKTPTNQSQRELELTPHRNHEMNSIPRMLAPSTALIKENPRLAESPIRSALPNFSASVNREDGGNTKMYQLPINIGKFLRRLQ